MPDVRLVNAGHPYYLIEADGGNRRERGSAIGRVARQHEFKRAGSPRYDETYGFQTRTTIRYVAS